MNPAVFKNRPRTFGTLPPAYLYVEAAFRSLRNFQAPRVAVLRDVTEQICSEAEMRRVSQLHPDVQLYGFYHLDPASPLYITRVAEILGDLKANGVESVIGCSYIDLCIQVPTPRIASHCVLLVAYCCQNSTRSLRLLLRLRLLLPALHV